MTRKSKRDRDQSPALRVPVAEQLLIDELPSIREARILCTTLGRGQFAAEAARQIAGARVVLHEFDIHLADEARRFLGGDWSIFRPRDNPASHAKAATAEYVTKNGPVPLIQVQTAQGGQVHFPAAASVSDASSVCRKIDQTPEESHGDAGQGGGTVCCAADLPDGEFDLAALPVDPRGEAELTRDMLQTAHLRLALGGRLISATANAEDQWLNDELRKLFPKVTRRPLERGVLYLATKMAPLKKIKRFDCEFAFRDRDRLIKVMSRPGVFSHRSLDAGARALINTMQIEKGARVLDIGCGSGAVALAAAFRTENVAVVALDSHARAVECTQRGAALNELTNIETRLTADGDSDAPGTFDLALGNPPYYSDHRIADIFLQAARTALKPGGTVLVVTQALEWYLERLPQLFEDVERHPHKTYTVLSGRRPG